MDRKLTEEENKTGVSDVSNNVSVSPRSAVDRNFLSLSLQMKGSQTSLRFDEI
jgi:hypothetical protein